jgi:3-dehydroquinate synthase
MTTYRQLVQVSFEYPIHFGHQFFHVNNSLVARTVSDGYSFVFLDAGLASAQPELFGRISGYFGHYRDQTNLVAPPHLFPGGEAAKTHRENLDAALDAIVSAPVRLCRQSYIIAVGGGSFLDIIGLAASLVHRGLRLIRFPSTVLAQNDAGVGVKSGMDYNGQKNFLGTFAPPYAVFCDFSLLHTLPDKYWSGGIAEAFKVALIQDAAFYGFLCEHADKLRNRDITAMEQLIERCAIQHLDHIRDGGDPFEFGSSRPLDFGHWAAHRLEVLSDYALGHGQAVAIGMALDACYAHYLGLLSSSQLDTFLAALSASGLPIYSPLLDLLDTSGNRKILRGLQDFREHLGGELTLTLPRGIGQRTEIHQVDVATIDRAINDLRILTERGR